MNWQSSISKAKRELSKEAAGLRKEIEAIQSRIRELEILQRPLTGSSKARPKRELSAKGRAAISKAAKKRWAAYRRKRKSER